MIGLHCKVRKLFAKKCDLGNVKSGKNAIFALVMTKMYSLLRNCLSWQGCQLLVLLLMSAVVADAQEKEDSSLTMRSRTDTLREVVVRPDTVLKMTETIRKSLGLRRQPSTKSLGDVLDMLSPGLQDKITHPFAIKDRKRDRKHKRDRKILMEYDRAKTSNELLEEALRREGLGAVIDSRPKK